MTLHVHARYLAQMYLFVREKVHRLHSQDFSF